MSIGGPTRTIFALTAASAVLFGSASATAATRTTKKAVKTARTVKKTATTKKSVVPATSVATTRPAPQTAAVVPSDGVTDKEVVLGMSAATTGAAAAIGSGVLNGQRAAFEEANAAGGVKMGDGVTRRIRLIHYDDAYDPGRALENTRRLCEQDKVFANVSNIGVPVMATETYANQRKCPQILIGAGHLGVGAVSNFWQSPLWPPISGEAKAYARTINDRYPQGKVALLVLDNDISVDFQNGLRDELKALGSVVEIAGVEKFAATDTSVQSQVARLAATRADALLFIGPAAPGNQALLQARDLGWKPDRYWYSAITSSTSLTPAGDAAVGVVTARWLKSPTSTDPAIVAYRKVVASHSSANPDDSNVLMGYTHGLVAIELLKRMKQPTREALMDAAYGLDSLVVPTAIEGISLQTSKTDHRPVEAFQLVRWDGLDFKSIGGIIQTKTQG